jgi:thiamine-monophosphate kinase
VLDVSDGLLGDLGHICERSRVAAVVELDLLPKSPLMQRHITRHAAQSALLGGGDDYELCFTAAPVQRAAVERAGSRAGVRVTRIGYILRAPAGANEVVAIDNTGLPMRLTQRGYDHFG